MKNFRIKEYDVELQFKGKSNSIRITIEGVEAKTRLGAISAAFKRIRFSKKVWVVTNIKLVN